MANAEKISSFQKNWDAIGRLVERRCRGSDLPVGRGQSWMRPKSPEATEVISEVDR
jgi:hypothetical protein